MVACDHCCKNVYLFNIIMRGKGGTMNALRTLGHRDSLLLVILICSCFCQAVNSEDCKPVDDSHCHCRTDSGYEINLAPLASESDTAPR